MEKRINEMAQDISQAFSEVQAGCRLTDCDLCVYNNKEQCKSYAIAERLDRLGYTKQEWISVEERLPNRDELVLCIGAKGGMFLGEIKFFKSFDKSAYAHVHNSHRVRYAKYWQPLPQPPQMKGE